MATDHLRGGPTGAARTDPIFPGRCSLGREGAREGGGAAGVASGGCVHWAEFRDTAAGLD